MTVCELVTHGMTVCELVTHGMTVCDVAYVQLSRQAHMQGRLVQGHAMQQRAVVGGFVVSH